MRKYLVVLSSWHRAPGYASSSHGGQSSSRGWFGIGSNNNRYNYGSSSRARPRGGLVAKLRRWLRDLYYYMKRYPVKVFFLVIMPLITGGALTKILSTVGIRLPPQLERMVGSNMNRGYGQNERFYSRGGARDFGGGSSLPGMGGGGIGGLGDMMRLAKMFM
ncbi:hypothetical protein OHC33_011206 [Knufia fluminis]|uniref:Uncharacterized protein n=1 Tax=Knufia fluminis TaxID=191047 RepID=A0AAN8EEI8_9EURO|nr:hypothetical protein OHC33_011206 [Knufia fluminis]